MDDAFHQRLATLSEAELRGYLSDPLAFRTEAVEAAAAELQRRGHEVPEARLVQVRATLQARDEAVHRTAGRWLDPVLGPDPHAWRRRIHAAAALILALGLGAAGWIRATAPPELPDPLREALLDSKKYLRQLEVVGGKSNVVATEFQTWFEGLWQGRALASTVAWLTLAAASLFLWLARRELRHRGLH